MELNSSFLTGLGCGFVIGMVSVVSLRKLFAYRNHSGHPENTAGNEYMIALVVRTDLGMGKGKIAAQCGHAAVGCVEKSQRKDPESLQMYKKTGEDKIALKIDSVEDIRKTAQDAKKMGLITSLIRDAGRTQIAANSITVLGIGPAPKDVINKITGHLKCL